MKQLSPFLFCLTLCAGCLTKDYQYAVICDFPAEYGGPNWLVVTDDAGNILKTFDVPELTTHLDERFNLDVEDRLETYNLHLVKKGPFLNYSSVFSFYGVGNGAAVTFNPLLDYTGPAPDAYKILSVKELAAPAVVEVPGNFYEYPQTWRYDAAAQTASMSVAFLNTSDFVVRIRPAGSASFHSLYVITDTMNGFFIKRQWSDFLPETNFRLIELSGGVRLTFWK